MGNGQDSHQNGVVAYVNIMYITMTMAYKDTSKRLTLAHKDREASTCLAKEPPN